MSVLDEHKEEIKKLAKSKTTKDLAEFYNVTYSFMRIYLIRNDITPKRTSPKFMPKEQARKELETKTAVKIAREHGYSVKAFQQYCYRNNLRSSVFEYKDEK